MTKHFRAEMCHEPHKGYYRLVYDGPKPRTVARAWAITEAKWDFTVAWYDAHSEPLLDGLFETCGLCMRFLKCMDCGECPVKQATGKSACYGTPYMEYSIALDYPSAGELQAAARAEWEFLRKVKERKA